MSRHFEQAVLSLGIVTEQRDAAHDKVRQLVARLREAVSDRDFFDRERMKVAMREEKILEQRDNARAEVAELKEDVTYLRSLRREVWAKFPELQKALLKDLATEERSAISRFVLWAVCEGWTLNEQGTHWSCVGKDSIRTKNLVMIWHEVRS